MMAPALARVKLKFSYILYQSHFPVNGLEFSDVSHKSINVGGHYNTQVGMTVKGAKHHKNSTKAALHHAHE